MDIAGLPIMRRDAQLSPQTFTATDNSVGVLWSTGATVRRKIASLFGGEEFDEQLIVTPEAVRLDRLNSGAPFLDSHSAYSLAAIIGVVVPGSATIVRGQGIARVQLSRAPEDAAVVQKIADGIIRNVSVGYRIFVVERVDEDGKAPLMRVTDWEPWEISAVGMGADPGAGMRGEAADTRYQFEIIAGAGGGRDDSAASVRMRMLNRQRGIHGLRS